MTHHTRKEISMRKCLIALFLLFGTVTFAKTWEANLRSCDGYGGFWFPNHNWTDKGEPWIKPFINGKRLDDYRETGISFNYDFNGKRESCYATVENDFAMKWTPITSESVESFADSVYFFMANCNRDFMGLYVCERELSLENFSIDDFALVKIDKYRSEDWILFNLGYNYYDYNYITGLYFIYKKYSEEFEYNALCNIELLKFSCDDSYAIQCEFQDDGTLNFDKLPDAKSIPEDFCSTLSIPPIRWGHFEQKKDFMNQPFYKVNGTPATKGSSNIIIKNKQSKLRLKGMQ